MPMGTVDLTLADDELRKCPHCGARMSKWYTPPESTWGTPYQYVCFNDECGYHQRGWAWMKSQYNKDASYRHRYNPFDGSSGPIPVWSKLALRERIMRDDEDAEEFAKTLFRKRP
jgi:hypothetical protein